MNSVPFLNSVPLRRLLRRHGNIGYLVVGLYLAGYWLYHFKRRPTLAVLTLAMAAGAFTLWPVTCHLTTRRFSASYSRRVLHHRSWRGVGLRVQFRR